MFGDDGIEMPFDPTTGAADSDAMTATFLRGGRLQRRRNTRVGAVALLSTFNPTLVGAKEEVRRRLPPGADLAEHLRVGREVFDDQRYFQEAAVPRMDVFHNFHAVEPRIDGDVFCGPHDRQWDADAGIYRRVRTGPRYMAEVKGPDERAAGDHSEIPRT